MKISSKFIVNKIVVAINNKPVLLKQHAQCIMVGKCDVGVNREVVITFNCLAMSNSHGATFIVCQESSGSFVCERAVLGRELVHPFFDVGFVIRLL